MISRPDHRRSRIAARVIAAIAILAGTPGAARAQAPGAGPVQAAYGTGDAEDGVCAPGWVPTFGQRPGIDGTVEVMAVHDDGSGPALYAGGWFMEAGGSSSFRTARWDGRRWSPLPPLYSGITAMAVYDDGSGPALFLGGDMPGILKGNGTSWSNDGGRLRLNSACNAFAVFDDGGGPALFAGGRFTRVGADLMPAERIARWNGTTWTTLGSGLNAPVTALEVFDDGNGPTLYVGGAFTSAGGVAVSSIARWDGVAWTDVGGGTDGAVTAFVVHDDGSGPALYAGGSFGLVAGQPAARVARWDGTAWSALAGTASAGSAVLSLVSHDDGGGAELYAAGSFTTLDGVAASRVARWNGSSWAAMGGGTGGDVKSLCTFDDGNGSMLYVGGAFATVDGFAARSIARWDGTSWAALGDGLDAGVRALATFDDGGGPALFAAGNFTLAGVQPLLSIGRWDGVAWTPLADGLTGPPGSTVRALAVLDLGGGPQLHAGGSFAGSGALAMDSIARWDGTSWSALGLGVQAGSTSNGIRALVGFDDGSGPALYAAGTFSHAGGALARNVARWDGTSWSPLGNGIGAPVHALTVFDDGNGPLLYAGGRYGVSRWSVSGWQSVSTIGGSWNREVRALVAHDDGSGSALYAAGNITMASGLPVNSIARWRLGQGWSPVGDGLPTPIAASNGVDALTVFDDGTGPALYAAGNHLTVAGYSALIARWDGASWSVLGSGTDGSVAALIVHDDGSGPALFAGGSFGRMNEMDDSALARWGVCMSVFPAFCDASDGSLTACPCGNAGSPDAGCDLPQATGGVRLDVLAQTTAPNGATLHGSGFSPSGNPFAVVIRASSLDPARPVVFGDGLRCVGTPLVHLATARAVAGASTHELGHTDAAGTFYYQLWFRSNPSTFCDAGAAFNLSSGRALTW